MRKSSIACDICGADITSVCHNGNGKNYCFDENGDVGVPVPGPFLRRNEWHKIMIDVCGKCKDTMEMPSKHEPRLIETPSVVKPRKLNLSFMVQVDGKRVGEFFASDQWTETDLVELALETAGMHRLQMEKFAIVPGKLINLIRKVKP